MKSSESAPIGKLSPAALSVFILALLLFSSCGSYHLGTTLPSDMRTVFVPTFKNITSEPGIETGITNAVINRFQVDGNLKTASREEADTILEGEITGWNRRVMGYGGQDKEEVEEYRLYITARIKFIDQRTGAVLLPSRIVKGKTDYYIDTEPLPVAEEAARPDAYRDLAKAVVDAVVSFW